MAAAQHPHTSLDPEIFSTDAPCSADITAVDALAAALAQAQYTTAAVEQLLGPTAVEALAEDDPIPAEVLLADEHSPLATLCKLWLLGQQLSATALAQALPTLGPAGLEALGLVTQSSPGQYQAVADLRPYQVDDQDLWVASDLGALHTAGRLRSDYVLGVGQASLSLAQATVRTPVDRALDIGVGCGVQTLHLLQHAQQVTVTDISARALAFARFTLAINRAELGLDEQLSRVQFCRGNLLAPVAGQKFDLIVSNPPFVITPRTSSAAGQVPCFEYRDGGVEGDGIVAQLVQHLPSLLNPGGVCQLLMNWQLEQGQPDPTHRVRCWAQEWEQHGWADTQLWLVQREEQTPLAYARLWLRDAAESRDAAYYRRRLSDYLADFAARKMRGVGFGYLLLRRCREGEAPWQRYEHNTDRWVGPIAAQLAQTVQRSNALACQGEPPTPSAAALQDFADQQLVAAADLSDEEYRRPGQNEPEVILLRQGAGLARCRAVSTVIAGIVRSCDGQFSVAELLAGYQALMEQHGQEPIDIPAAVAELADLYMDGFLAGHHLNNDV